MRNRIGSQTNNAPQAGGFDALSALDALYKLEVNDNIMALRQRRAKERLSRSLAQWAQYWPMALGVVVSFFAPQIREFSEYFHPWGMWISFPMVALTMRPEMHLSTSMSAMLPTMMLYMQFPLEGYMAKVALRGQVTVPGVLVHLLYFHGLCIINLWILNGGILHLLGR